MHPFKGRAARALKRAMRYPRELRAEARDQTASARGFPYYLSACAIFRKEAPYLAEWLVFHLGVGVEHFYLYENRSTDDFRTVLAPFVERRQVTLADRPKPQGQKAAYRHCLSSAAAPRLPPHNVESRKCRKLIGRMNQNRLKVRESTAATIQAPTRTQYRAIHYLEGMEKPRSGRLV